MPRSTLYAQWGASYISGKGTAADPYLISSAEHWNLFASNVNNGNTYSGKFIKLEADITVSTMAGTYDTPFSGTFIGTYAPVTYASEDRSVLFMGSGSNLYYPDGFSPVTINACRAYFMLNGITAGDPASGGDVKGFVLNFNEDDADGINSLTPGEDEIVNGKSSNSKWYDLAGRKMVNGKLPKGIYIRDGKKIMVK